MPKVFIIAAVSMDGFIAKDTNHPALWTSKADKKRFIELTKNAGVIVMGSTTYKTIMRPLKDRLNVVYSRNHVFEGVEMTNDEPKVLINKLAERGFKEIAICGGSNIYSMFLEAGVVDTIYLTVEPIIFGKGINLFNKEMLHHLKLIDSKVSESGGSLLLEYKVDYSGVPRII